MTRTRKILGWLLAGALPLSALPAAARAEGQATFGSQWWDQSRPESRFQEFRDLARGGFLESFALSQWNGRNVLTLSGTNALRRDQTAALELANGARWRMDLDHTQSPHRYSLVGRSAFTQIAPGVLALPDSVQSLIQANPAAYAPVMSDLLAAAPRADQSVRTESSRARLRARPAKEWQLEVRGVMRQRAGEKPLGASQGLSSTLEVLEPVRQRTLDADLILDYHKRSVSLRASAGLSDFRNDVGVLRWDNPNRYVSDVFAGTAVNQLDLYPDNRVVRGNVAFGVRLPRRTALAVSAGVSEAKQNDAWLPYTSNDSLPEPKANPLPGSSTEGKVRSQSVDARLTTRAVPRLSASLRFNFHRRDDRTPIRTFAGHVLYDNSWQDGPIQNEAFGNRQTTAGVDLDFAPASRVSVGGLYELRRRERTDREIDHDKENVYGGQARIVALDGLVLQARYRHGERKPDRFDPGRYQDGTGTFLEQPGLRRFDVAERRRDEAGGGVSVALGDKVDLYAGYTYDRDNYPDSDLGLKKDEQRTVTAEGSLHASERMELRGGYGFTGIKSEQVSRFSSAAISSNPLDDWRVALKDRNVFVFAGTEWWAMPSKLSFRVDYQFDHGFGDFGQTNGRATAKSLPGTLYRHHEALVQAHYRWTASSEVTGRYGFERFGVADYALQGLPLITGTFGLYLGNVVQGYDAHRVALLLTQKF